MSHGRADGWLPSALQQYQNPHHIQSIDRRHQCIVILLLSVPTSISGIFRFRCTSLLISPIGGRSWLYKLLYKCMKCGYEKEQIWYEKLSWGMKLHRHINSDIWKRPKHYFQIKPPLDKGCHMRVVRKNAKTHTCGPDVAVADASWNISTICF